MRANCRRFGHRCMNSPTHQTRGTMLALITVMAWAAGGRVVMEEGVRTVSSPTWSQIGRCAPSDAIRVHLTIVLSPAARTELEDAFWAVSDPKNVRYGQHLSPAEIADVVAVPEDALSNVTAFLHAHGAFGIHVATTRDIIGATLACADAEAAFGTTIHRFKHGRTGLELLRATAPHSLPDDVARLIGVVGDLAGLPDPRGPAVVTPAPAKPSQRASAVAPVGGFPESDRCSGKCALGAYVTPAVLTTAYNLGDSPKTAKGRMAVAEFQGVMWDAPALAKFSTACQLTPPVNVSTQIGPNKAVKCEIPIVGTEFCAEAMLDIEYIGALGGAIPLMDIESQQYSLLHWAQQVLDLPSDEIPMVMSVSYGNDEKQQTSKEFMEQCNQQFMKMGLAGISVLFAAGDQGVLGREGGGARYHPDFPASSPYITAVGGTDFATKGTIGPEKAWTQGGGGFSDTFPRPLYQVDAVGKYLKAAAGNLPAQSKWNITGRAYPDVAALGGEGNPYCINVFNSFTGVAGTSASCPVVAATIAKLNEVRLAKGGRPMGFLNPWIYGNASTAWNDVTEGRNCGNPMCKGTDGFPAVAGWDAATGWGTPDFEKLKALV